MGGSYEYNWSYTGTTTASKGAKTTYSDPFALEEKFGDSAFWLGLSYDLKQSTEFTWVDQWNALTTNMTGQSAKVHITGPSTSGGCADEYNVYADNVYGTLMVSPVPAQKQLVPTPRKRGLRIRADGDRDCRSEKRLSFERQRSSASIPEGILMDFMILNRPFLPTNSFSSVVLASIFAVGATFTVGKLFAAFLRRTDESTLGRAVVEAVILLTASRGDASHVLRDAAKFYKVDVAAITTTVKQEFAAKEKTKAAKTATPKPAVKAPTKTAKRVAA